MRHYYRFMELEPVMEQEEDSVGDVSPTSSTGSPSLSPPPDAWTQLSGKEYHDALSNHLLQEHLELQRAYRMLEMQYRNCDTRASRDLQRLKEVLPNQERLREELQRAKERETALRGEIYDLQEQNELLEFRILELGECHENASIRGANPETRDVGTETSCSDVRDVWTTTVQSGDQADSDALGHQERLTDAPQTPFNSTTQCQPPDDREHQQPGEVEQHDERCHTSTSQHCGNAHEVRTASPDPQINLQQCTKTQYTHQITQNEVHTRPIEQRIEDSKEVSLFNSTQINTQLFIASDSECSNTLTSLSESISCTLCRTLPRRRSASSQPSVTDLNSTNTGNTIERETLRKSKSDGEIQVRYCSNQQETSAPTEKYDSHLNEDKVVPVPSGGEQRSTKVLNHVQRLNDRCDLVGGKWPLSTNPSGARIEDQVKTMRSMLTAIYDVLRETRVEVECTNSELREEVQTLETTVQRLTEEVTRRGRASSSEEEPLGTRATSGPPLVRRSRSLSFSKDCYCCSQDLRPSLEDVISKLQQLMDLVFEKEPTTGDESLVNPADRSGSEKKSGVKDAATAEPLRTEEQILPVVEEQNHAVEMESKLMGKHIIVQNITTSEIDSSVEVGVEDKRTTWKIAQQETQTKENVVDLHSVTVQETAVLDASSKKLLKGGPSKKLHRALWKSEPLLTNNKTQQSQEPELFAGKFAVENEIFQDAAPGNVLEKPASFYSSNSSSCYETPKLNAADELDQVLNKKEMDPLPEEKTKPVLRRWREQLIVRRDRVQPWRIELLDFPKRQPSVV